MEIPLSVSDDSSVVQHPRVYKHMRPCWAVFRTSSSGALQRSSFFSARTCALQRPQYQVSLASRRSGCRNACADRGATPGCGACSFPGSEVISAQFAWKPRHTHMLGYTPCTRQAEHRGVTLLWVLSQALHTLCLKQASDEHRVLQKGTSMAPTNQAQVPRKPYASTPRH